MVGTKRRWKCKLGSKEIRRSRSEGARGCPRFARGASKSSLFVRSASQSGRRTAPEVSKCRVALQSVVIDPNTVASNAKAQREQLPLLPTKATIR